jgi:hypothetical protein
MSPFVRRGDINIQRYSTTYIIFNDKIADLIFGHKRHIDTPYRGKRFWTHQIPTSCLPTLVGFYTHWTYMDIFEVGIWRVQKHYAQYGIPIWCLWPNIRFLPSTVTEKIVTKNILDGRTDGQTEVKQYTPLQWVSQTSIKCKCQSLNWHLNLLEMYIVHEIYLHLRFNWHLNLIIVFVENHACTIKIPAKFIFKGSVFLQPSGQIGLGLWYLMPLSTMLVIA